MSLHDIPFALHPIDITPTGHANMKLIRKEFEEMDRFVQDPNNLLNISQNKEFMKTIQK